MSIRGRAIETSFTPGVAGVVRVTVKFAMAWDASGGGAGVVFREQSGTTLYGNAVGPAKKVLQAFTAEAEFAVTAGSLVKVGLAADSGSPYRMSFYDLELTAKFFPS